MEQEVEGDDYSGSPIREEAPKGQPEGVAHPSLWDKNYYTKSYTIAHLPFSKDFRQQFLSSEQNRDQVLIEHGGNLFFLGLDVGVYSLQYLGLGRHVFQRDEG